MSRPMTRILIVLVVFFAIFATATAADPTAPTLARIAKSGELRVGTSGAQPPFSVKSKEGKLIGYEIDLAMLLAESMGVKLTLVEKPFPELLSALEKGEVDAVMSGMTMTPERNMSVAFAGPYFVSGKAVLTRSETLARATKPGVLDASKVKLVTLEGTTSQGFVENAMPNANLVTAPTYEKAVAMVIGGEVDALVADYPICVVSVLRNPGAGLQSVISPFTFEPIGIALPADDMLFVNLVQNYLKSLEGTGLLDQVRQKWFADPSWLLELP
jgi:polar amino acid transport system substrate-binding protein